MWANATCECANPPDVVRLDEHPALASEPASEQLEHESWYRLVRCRSCGQLWSPDGDDVYPSRRYAIKVPQREGWLEFDTKPLRMEFLIRSRGGLTDEPCIWAGCQGQRVRGVVYCEEHLYQTGARE